VISKEDWKDKFTIRIEQGDPPLPTPESVKARLLDAVPCLRTDIEQSQTIAEPSVVFLPSGTLHHERPIKRRVLVDERERL
jgi:hypothetical protein